MWLTNFVIDLCLSCFLKMNPNSTKNVTPVNCNTSSIIFRTFCKSIEGSDIFTDGELDKIPPSRGVLIMPTNTGGNHWVLPVANTNEETFTFLDPQGSKTQTRKSYFALFLNTMIGYYRKNEINFSVDGWKNLDPPKHAIQKDSVNCGVFVLMFAEDIIKGKKIKTKLDPFSCRHYLKNILIENGTNIKNPPPNHIIKLDAKDPLNYILYTYTKDGG